MTRQILILSVFSFFVWGCSNKTENQFNVSEVNKTAPLHSYQGDEYKVNFKAIYKTSDYKIEDILSASNALEIQNRIISEIKGTTKFLFGPLTHRELGGQKLNYIITADWNLVVNGSSGIEIPYIYSGTWLVTKTIVGQSLKIELPLPFNTEVVFTEDWLKCTDTAPEHQTESFYWYFWDPKRSGCDNKVNQHYQNILITLSDKTVNQLETFPEYSKLINSASQKNNLQMTFAFGYVEDQEDANPDKDSDYGMLEYRKFIKFMNAQSKVLKLQKLDITQKEYLNANDPDKKIGYRYLGFKNGVKVDIKVIAAANIDQMDLFAQSYAHDHDGFFAWFGHSRVGSGFDANNFANMLRWNPEYYTLHNDYQLVYWAGCNSYSYYTLPFFDQKASLNKVTDPNGTKNLDIISNTLPSLFAFNAKNAIVAYSALINWEIPTSFQTLIKTIEKNGDSYGFPVLVNVMGDEDNIKP